MSRNMQEIRTNMTCSIHRVKFSKFLIKELFAKLSYPTNKRVATTQLLTCPTFLWARVTAQHTFCAEQSIHIWIFASCDRPRSRVNLHVVSAHPSSRMNPSKLVPLQRASLQLVRSNIVANYTTEVMSYFNAKGERTSQAEALKETLQALKTPDDILAQRNSTPTMAGKASKGDFPIGQVTPSKPTEGSGKSDQKKGDAPKVFPLYLANKPVRPGS